MSYYKLNRFDYSKMTTRSKIRSTLDKLGLSCTNLEYVIFLRYNHEFKSSNKFLFLKNMASHTNVSSATSNKYPIDIEYEYSIYANKPIDDFAMTKYVSNMSNKPIELILTEFNFMNPMQKMEIIPDKPKHIWNLILIKILANSFALVDFYKMIVKKTKCKSYPYTECMVPCSKLVNQLLLDKYDINNCTYNQLNIAYPSQIKRISSSNKDGVIEFIRSLYQIILDYQNLFCSQNKIIIESSIDAKALIGKQANIHSDLMQFFNYKLIKDLVKTTINTNDNFDQIIITDLVEPVYVQYTGEYVIEI